jgi:hypothetical protein
MPAPSGRPTAVALPLTAPWSSSMKMNRWIGLTVAALAAFAQSACVVESGNDTTPDMKFSVTFASSGCQAAGVGSVRLTFVNPAFGSAQTFPCSDATALLILVPNVPADTGGNGTTYRVHFDAFDANDPSFIAFADTFDIVHTVGGTHENAVDLQPVTEVLTNFTFAGFQPPNGGTPSEGMTCAEAGIASLKIVVDGSLTFNNVACSANGLDAASLTGINPGNHGLVIDAFDGSGSRLYHQEYANIPVNRGANNEFTLNLAPLAKAGVEFQWDFGSTNASCAQASVANIQYVLRDAGGAVVDQRSLQCGQQPVTFGFGTAGQLDAGVYTLSMSATDNFGGLYGVQNARLYAPAGRTQGFVVTLTR